MHQKRALENYKEILRCAEPRLTVRLERMRLDPEEGETCKIDPFIRENYLGWDKFISEGYEATNHPLGCPVYWRAVIRGTERLYLCTVLVTPDEIIEAWGKNGLAYRDPITGHTTALLEYVL